MQKDIVSITISEAETLSSQFAILFSPSRFYFYRTTFFMFSIVLLLQKKKKEATKTKQNKKSVFQYLKSTAYQYTVQLPK